MRHNRLTALPAALGQCGRLQELLLSFNALSALPACVYALPALAVLVASDNKLAALDGAGVRRLTRLACLDLANNDLAAVPPELGLLAASLKKLQLEGNPCKVPRPADLARGTAHVLQLLRNRLAGDAPGARNE